MRPRETGHPDQRPNRRPAKPATPTIPGIRPRENVVLQII
jgi:hypothetical protein